MMESFKGRVWIVILLSEQALASGPMFPKFYEVTTEIGMPHLEENLRYATTRETSCLKGFDPVAFPMLKHEALQGCHLQYEKHRDETISYALICVGPQGATGDAQWQIDSNQIRGTLNVKLGGKNMTFYQRITATQVGDCLPSVSSP